MYYRIPDSRDILFMRSHLQGGTLVDVGANVGLMALLLADKIQHAMLFEPNPAAAARARQNLALNGLRFEVHEFALSDSSGDVEIEDQGGVSTCNRTVAGFSTSFPTRRVPCLPLDEFLSQYKLAYPVTAVKIDVEGHENHVIRGMMQFLRRHRPRLVMFEYLRRTNLAETLGLFAATGYTVLEATPEGARVATSEVAPLQNLFACPNECLQEFVPHLASELYAVPSRAAG